MTKINFELSSQEFENVQNAEFFFVKHRVIDKVYQLFGEVSTVYESLFTPFQAQVDPSMPFARPKISRGENYQLLPYVMLDYPRLFKTEDSFAIRSLFWWGNEFSIHLVLSGTYAVEFEESIINGIKNTLDDQWYYSFTDDPWHHHFNPDNYLPINNYIKEEKKYFKLAKKLPLHNSQQAGSFFIDSFTQLINILKK